MPSPSTIDSTPPPSSSRWRPQRRWGAPIVAMVWVAFVFWALAKPLLLPAPFPGLERQGQVFRPIYNPELAARLDQGLRDFWQKPEQLLDQLEPLSGLVIADIGAGEGYFSLRLAERVGPQGHVIATDIRSSVLETLAGRIPDDLNGRLSLVLADENRLGIESAVDLLWVVQVFGEISEKRDFLLRLKQIMHGGSRLVIIDAKHVTDPQTGFTRPLNLNALVQQFQLVGLQIDPEYPPDRFNFLPKQYCFVLKKNDVEVE